MPTDVALEIGARVRLRTAGCGVAWPSGHAPGHPDAMHGATGTVVGHRPDDERTGHTVSVKLDAPIRATGPMACPTRAPCWLGGWFSPGELVPLA